VPKEKKSRRTERQMARIDDRRELIRARFDVTNHRRKAPVKPRRFANKMPQNRPVEPSENAEKRACIKFPNRYDLRLLAPS
jgi:hypothetical protein